MSSPDALELLTLIASASAAVTVLRLRHSVRPNTWVTGCAALALSIAFWALLSHGWVALADTPSNFAIALLPAANAAPAMLSVLFGLAAATGTVTQWRNERRRLTARATHFQAVLEKAPLQSLIVDDTGVIVEYENAHRADAAWFSRRNVVGLRCWDLPGTSPQLALQLKKAITDALSGDAVSFVCEQETIDGSIGRLEFSLSRIDTDFRQEPVVHIAVTDRTEIRQHELALEEASKHHRGLILNSPDAIACVEYEKPGISPQWSLERQIDAFFAGTLVVCNDRYAKLIGYTRSGQIVGKKMNQLMPRTKVGIEFITRIITSGYDLRGWDSRLGRGSGDDGKMLHLTNCTGEFVGDRLARAWVVYRDISDKLEKIDAVALSAERHASLLRAQESYFCFQHDPAIDISLPVEQQAAAMFNARLIECNAAYAQLIGVDGPDAVVGMTLAEIVRHGIFRKQEEDIRSRLLRFIAGGYSLEDDRRDAIQPDGTPFITFLNSRGVVRHGHLTHHWGLMLDVSEREARQRALKRSEAQFERMAENSPALIYRIRMDDCPRFDFVNEAVHAISGYPREIAMNDDRVLRELFSTRNLELLLTQIEIGSTEPVLTKHFHSDERLIHLEHRVVPVRDASGDLRYIEGVALDVTERLSSQQQLHTALNRIRELKDQLQKENSQLRHEIRSARGFDLIVGRSRAIAQALELAAKAAPTDATILILGETGTGKELFARSIHKSSPRCDSQMISVNCAALPPTLIESELFGHSRGAFTGANANRIGRFEAADGGTLFLDEIGEMSLDLQGKLLRVVQEGTFERLGDSRTITVNVRLIAATNKDLVTAVERGEFRADLYYRLNVFPIVVPPLRTRLDDIPLLANHFAAKHSFRLNKKFDAISPSFLRELMNHGWPGNVRELEAVIERSIIVSPGGTLQAVELTTEYRHLPGAGYDDLERAADVFDRGLHDAERHHILHALHQTNWVIEGPDGAATRLGIAPSTLRSRMKKLGIRRPQQIDSDDLSLKSRHLH